MSKKTRLCLFNQQNELGKKKYLKVTKKKVDPIATLKKLHKSDFLTSYHDYSLVSVITAQYLLDMTKSTKSYTKCSGKRNFPRRATT